MGFVTIKVDEMGMAFEVETVDMRDRSDHSIVQTEIQIAVAEAIRKVEDTLDVVLKVQRIEE